jgi:hypothetical protein
VYSGRKITESLGNVTVTGEKDGKGEGEARRRRVCLSMRSITENIYCSQLSSVAILLQPEPNCFTSYNTRKGLGSVSLCVVVLWSSLPSHVSTCNGQRSSQLFFVLYNYKVFFDFTGLTLRLLPSAQGLDPFILLIPGRSTFLASSGLYRVAHEQSTHLKIQYCDILRFPW